MYAFPKNFAGPTIDRHQLRLRLDKHIESRMALTEALFELERWRPLQRTSVREIIADLSAVLEHLENEENEIYPQIVRRPEQMAAILSDHTEIRKAYTDLAAAVNVDPNSSEQLAAFFSCRDHFTALLRSNFEKEDLLIFAELAANN